MVVRYSLNGGEGIEFVVPKEGQNLRWAAHSCNGEFEDVWFGAGLKGGRGAYDGPAMGGLRFIWAEMSKSGKRRCLTERSSFIKSSR